MRASVRLLRAAPVTKAKAAQAAKKAATTDSPDAEAMKWGTELLRPISPPPPLTEPERARRRRLMIAYGYFCRAEHRAIQRKQQAFAVAKWSALDALPNFRRVEAMSQPPPEKPFDVPVMTHTPAIPGFNVGDLTGKK